MATINYESGDDHMTIQFTRQEQIIAMRLLGRDSRQFVTFVTDWLRQRHEEAVSEDKRTITARMENATDLERAAIKLALGLF